MKTIINNENKEVEVSTGLFNYLKEQFNQGFWMILIKVKGEPHMIPTNQFA